MPCLRRQPAAETTMIFLCWFGPPSPARREPVGATIRGGRLEPR
jgi:hypothetical protein